MNASTLYLHIGPHKTGSTYIQRFFHTNRKKFLEKGIYYPQGIWHASVGSYFSTDPKNFIFNIHSGRSKLGNTHIKREDNEYMKNFCLDLARASETACSTLLSYEGFISLDEKELYNLKNFFLQKFEKVIVIFYWREPLSFAASEMSQRARMGVDIGLNKSRTLPILKYRDFMSKFIKCFEVEYIKALNYSTPKSDIGLIGDFLKTIGLSDKFEDFSFDVPNNNKSISYEAFMLAKSLKLFDNANQIGNEFYKKYDDLLSALKGRKIFLEENQKLFLMKEADIHTKFVFDVFSLDVFCSIDNPENKEGTTEEFFISLAQKIHECFSHKQSK